jgi:hypothetical protein
MCDWNFTQFFKYMSKNTFTPIEIGLPYQEGATQEEYFKVWGCPVKLGQTDGYICFDQQLLNIPSPTYEPELLKIHEHHAESQLERLNKHQLIQQIERILANGLLESGEFDQNIIA